MATKTINTSSFKQLFEDHYNLICNYLHGQTRDWELAEEVAQKTFVKLWEKREHITLTTSAKSYLFQSAKNTLIDHFRAQKNFKTHSDRYSTQIDKVATLTMIEEDPEGVKCKLSWAIDQLKPKTKEIFLLNKREGLTYEEIADYLSISKRTVEYNMKNALIKLRELLKDKLD